ncbi:GpE family phage tail protein [Burkholderia sp. Ac-20345]|nr:GpE family phage tail protein [Burkholderia sp. Ac-20345]
MIDRESLRKAGGLLARWFRFQPSEINALDIAELIDWSELAAEQIESTRKAEDA